VRGIIIDSAPAEVTPELAARGVVSALTATAPEELSFGAPGPEVRTEGSGGKAQGVGRAAGAEGDAERGQAVA
jgi:hypothetical protein